MNLNLCDISNFYLAFVTKGQKCSELKYFRFCFYVAKKVHEIGQLKSCQNCKVMIREDTPVGCNQMTTFTAKCSEVLKN